MRISVSLITAAGLGLCAGCGGISRHAATEAIDGIAQHTVWVRYDIDYVKAKRAFRLVRPDGGRRVLDYYDAALTTTPRWRFDTVYRRLDVAYPASEGATVAAATVETWVRGERLQAALDTKNVFLIAWEFLTLPVKGITGLDYQSRYEHHEKFQLTIPADEVGEVLEALLVEGYFDHAYRPYDGVTVKVWLDRTRDGKNWEPAPKLDALADRVRLEGQQLALDQADDSPLKDLRSDPGKAF